MESREEDDAPRSLLEDEHRSPWTTRSTSTTDTTSSTSTTDTTLSTSATNTTPSTITTVTTCSTSTTDIIRSTSTTDTTPITITTVTTCSTSTTDTTGSTSTTDIIRSTSTTDPACTEADTTDAFAAASTGAAEGGSQHKPWTAPRDRPGEEAAAGLVRTGGTMAPVPPSSLALTQPTKKKVLLAPALSLSLGRSESTVSEDFPPAFLSPSPEEDEDAGLDFDLDAMETPSDSESLPFPVYDLEEELRRLGVAPHRRRPLVTSSSSLAPSTATTDLEREDIVDSQGTRWRCFSTGDPPQESRVNMSVLEPFLRVLSHGGYYGDGMNDIIVFSSCYLPQNSLHNYQYVMDHLFRYVVGTLELMVAENYVMVYLCAGGQKDRVPGIGWLRECYTTIDRRLRKNLKGFYVVHPTWYIKALITIIKPFISSKFSRKLQFVDSLQDLSHLVPTEHVQIPDCVRHEPEDRYGTEPYSSYCFFAEHHETHHFRSEPFSAPCRYEQQLIR
ncbi:bcl-2/adenovirus E1B 19 kDa-interacting protein 2-like protein isoform X2 [Betta splendens]|uniref:Bcl-2/adenovirus E1B 19 kDa-interacting protein 2-like protein isoform X2 n=1 Tax=Betta splendens TaxID=158456 RepID=A0A9W2Y3L0_BETSP|nr:bcl-2/adenovirus E1B 19 kDa-interacting protein 2-like protein isoform X2 [Betta splendens]XP_055368717.1 bcl-2/adenovirus E1B 19 kDa-interacting protein 2-like protein isoform X2 [Betta splendens]